MVDDRWSGEEGGSLDDAGDASPCSPSSWPRPLDKCVGASIVVAAVIADCGRRVALETPNIAAAAAAPRAMASSWMSNALRSTAKSAVVGRTPPSPPPSPPPPAAGVGCCASGGKRAGSDRNDLAVWSPLGDCNNAGGASSSSFAPGVDSCTPGFRSRALSPSSPPCTRPMPSTTTPLTSPSSMCRRTRAPTSTVWWATWPSPPRAARRCSMASCRCNVSSSNTKRPVPLLAPSTPLARLGGASWLAAALPRRQAWGGGRGALAV